MKTTSLTTTSKSRNTGIIVVLLLILIVPGIYGKNAYSSKHDAAIAQKTVNKELSQELQKARKVKSDPTGYATKLEIANTAIPTNIDLDGAINAINVIATNNNVTWSNGTPTKANTSNGLVGYQFSMAVQGSADNINTFLFQLHEAPRIFVTQNLTVSSSKKDDVISSSAQLTVAIFSLSDSGAK